MKLTSSILLALLAAALPLADACKCIMNHGMPNIDWTLKCCALVKGAKATADDCNAHSMSKKLADFHDCCQGMGMSLDTTTDCRCPAGCKKGDSPYRNLWGRRWLSTGQDDEGLDA